MSDPTVYAEQQEIVGCSASEDKVPAQEGDVIICADIHLSNGHTVQLRIKLGWSIRLL